MATFKAIHHVSMIVSDLDKSLVFYCKVLGLKVNLARPDMKFNGAWLDINDQQQIHLLQIDNPDSIHRPIHGGRDRHTAFITEDLARIEDKLKKSETIYTKSQSGRTALFCRDPDGNTLEIIEYDK